MLKIIDTNPLPNQQFQQKYNQIKYNCEANAKDLIQKPIDVNKVLDIVKHILLN